MVESEFLEQLVGFWVARHAIAVHDDSALTIFRFDRVHDRFVVGVCCAFEPVHLGDDK